MTSTAPVTTSTAPSENRGLVPGPLCWEHLTKDEARALWKELHEWVTWLRDAYQLGTKIKPCWPRHSPVVRELTALMAAHKAVYFVGRDEEIIVYREDATAWHTQWYRSSLEVVQRLLADCSGEKCSYKHQVPVEDPGINQFITADVERRSNSRNHQSSPQAQG
ncbi:hypothetical protein ACFWPH_28200 [Nocardia sp. NPDC058499]|uniref:hypothetical protein n=1 Tax=Nocardia sp. NPDC058499 TaxID=3346530 RepID=UPI003664E811